MRLQDEKLLRHFAYAHLPPLLQMISMPFGQTADQMISLLPENEERTAMLRKLLEAKDCAVRAMIQGADEGEYVA